MAKEPLKGFWAFFGQNSDNLDRFLVKFHSKLNIFIYHTILIFKLGQQQFSPKVTKLLPYHLNERTIHPWIQRGPWIQRRPWITSSAEPDLGWGFKYICLELGYTLVTVYLVGEYLWKLSRDGLSLVALPFWHSRDEWPVLVLWLYLGSPC